MTTQRTTPDVADAPTARRLTPPPQAKGKTRIPSHAAGTAPIAELLAAAFERQPLIDGEAHPADAIISDFLESDTSIAYPSALESIVLRYHDANLAAATLQCAARFEPRWSDWRKADLVRNGLRADNIGLRDAAVRAAECWICPEVIQVLENHQDQTPWLQEYIDEVIADADFLAAIRGAQS